MRNILIWLTPIVAFFGAAAVLAFIVYAAKANGVDAWSAETVSLIATVFALGCALGVVICRCTENTD